MVIDVCAALELLGKGVDPSIGTAVWELSGEMVV